MGNLSGTVQMPFANRATEKFRFSIDQPEIDLIRDYLREAVILEGVVIGLGLENLGFRVSARVGEGASFEFREPNVMQRAALLHHLRPFVLDDEPFSFFKARNVVARAARGDFIRDWLKEVKRIFSGAQLQDQVRIASGDVLINSEATLRKWLNAFEYHRDADKAAELEATFARLPAGMSRPVLFMLLMQKADAVRFLGNVVHKILAVVDGPAIEEG